MQGLSRQEAARRGSPTEENFSVFQNYNNAFGGLLGVKFQVF